MRILAFDLGRTTGWAVLEDGELLTGSYSAGGIDEADVFVEWWKRTQITIAAGKPDAIAFEDVTFNRGRSFIPGMMALLYVLAARERITAFGVNVQTLKAFAHKWASPVGKWTGSKDNMYSALMRRLGTETVCDMTEDEVDASWAALWLDETAVETPEPVPGA